MRKLLVVASLILTVVMFASGYVVIFATSMMAIVLGLPGPYAQTPIGWVWLALHVIMLFGASLLFCRWFSGRIKKRSEMEDTAE